MLEKQTLSFTLVRGDAAIAQVSELAAVIWPDYFEPIIGVAQVEYMLASFQSIEAITEQLEQGILYFMITHNDTPIGYTAFEVKSDEQELFISKLYIAKTHRGQGLGRMSLSFLEDFANRQKCQKMRLAVNKKNTLAITVYEKYGFTIANDFVADIGEGFVMDDYGMEKDIADKR